MHFGKDSSLLSYKYSVISSWLIQMDICICIIIIIELTITI